MNLKHDPAEAFEGVCWAYRGGWLTLRDVMALHAGQAPTKVPGDLLIHVENIAFTQVLP